MIENFLRFFAVDFLRAEIDEHQVVVGAAGDDAVAVFGETSGERFRVDHDLALVFAELRLERFVKADRLCGDDVHERTALDAGENGRVDLLGESFLAHDDAAARPAQTFVRGGGDKLRVRNGAGMLATGDEPGDVRHVDEEKRADRVGDLAQPREIDDARIGGRAGGDHERADFFGLFLQRVVIDLLGLFAHAVLRHCVKFAGEIRRMAVGEMAAVGEIHGENLVARFQHAKNRPPCSPARRCAAGR